MSKIIGIDLGTTNSVVSVLENGSVKIITNSEGDRTTPSVVAFTKDGELVGKTAQRQTITNHESTVYSAKRFIGAKFSERSKETSKMPYKVKASSTGQVCFEVNGKEYSAPEISARILQKLKKEAEAYLGETVSEAVITVPAYFDDNQRQATKDAGKIAGLDVKRIINEPTAAALAYGADKKVDHKIVVYDFGGGTFDVSVLEVGADIVEVLATNGDTLLGGDNIDEVLISWMAREFKEAHGIDISKDKLALQRLKEAAEKAKIELSSAVTTKVNLPFLTADATGPKHLEIDISRAKFEELISSLVEKTLIPCKKAIQDAGISVKEIDEVLLVGGSTRIPLVQETIKKYFGKEPNKSVNPDEVVAMGAAIQAGVLSGDVDNLLLLDVTPLSLGIETKGGVFSILINKNTTIPTHKSQVFSTAEDNQTLVGIHVLQGERGFANDNKTLAKFELTDIPLAPRGVPQIEVSFNIDANGIVNVMARDVGTGKEHKIVIQSEGMSDDDIKKAVSDAESNAEDDSKRVKLVTTKNHAESVAYQAEKLLKDHKIDEASASKIESLVDALKSTLESDDVTTIKQAEEDLESDMHRLAETIYKTAGEQKTEPSFSADDIPEDIIDAEFEEK